MVLPDNLVERTMAAVAAEKARKAAAEGAERARLDEGEAAAMRNKGDASPSWLRTPAETGKPPPLPFMKVEPPKAPALPFGTGESARVPAPSFGEAPAQPPGYAMPRMPAPLPLTHPGASSGSPLRGWSRHPPRGGARGGPVGPR